MNKEKVMVIGVGNVYRHDDGAGIAAARLLKAGENQYFKAVESSGEAAGLLESWKGWDKVILVDAVQSGSAPGSIHRFNAREQALPAQFLRSSTHAFSVAEAIELGRAFNDLPESLVVYGIEGKNFEEGEGLSSEVEASAQKVAERILKKIGRVKKEVSHA